MHCSTLSCRAIIIPALLLAAACGPAAPPQASATAASETRQYTGTWTATGTRQTLQLGADRRASTFRLTGSLLLHGEQRPAVGFKAEVIGLTDSVTGMQARAVWTDAHGEKVFSELRGAGNDPGRLIQGTVTGGTGRYAGVSGEYTFQWQILMDTEDGTVSGRVVDMKGWARLPAATGGRP